MKEGLYLVLSNYSNTTLVKVKFLFHLKIIGLINNSNTTLVKVKCEMFGKTGDELLKFKYNTC